MNKNVFKKRCFYFLAFIYTIIIFRFLIDQYDIYLKKRNNIKKINSQLKNINNYIDKCKKGILTRHIFKSSSKPKITALITVFNSEKYVGTAIRSVQNQNFNDIEILIVDDSSWDNSIGVILKHKKLDKRIKLIRNKVNKGIL